MSDWMHNQLGAMLIRANSVCECVRITEGCSSNWVIFLRWLLEKWAKRWWSRGETMTLQVEQFDKVMWKKIKWKLYVVCMLLDESTFTGKADKGQLSLCTHLCAHEEGRAHTYRHTGGRWYWIWTRVALCSIFQAGWTLVSVNRSHWLTRRCCRDCNFDKDFVLWISYTSDWCLITSDVISSNALPFKTRFFHLNYLCH